MYNMSTLSQLVGTFTIFYHIHGAWWPCIRSSVFGNHVLNLSSLRRVWSSLNGDFLQMENPENHRFQCWNELIMDDLVYPILGNFNVYRWELATHGHRVSVGVISRLTRLYLMPTKDWRLLFTNHVTWICMFSRYVSLVMGCTVNEHI